MNSLWTNIESHIIKLINAKKILVIGLESKSNTLEILDFCKKNQIYVTLVDSVPNFDVDELEDNFKEVVEVHKEPGINKLALPNNYDAILLRNTGDWYETYNELQQIQKNCLDKEFPIVFIYDVCSAEDSPSNSNNENIKKPISTLNPVNDSFRALNDFINESNLKLSYITLPVSTCITILFDNNHNLKEIIKPLINEDNIVKIQTDEKENLDLLYSESKNEQKTLKKEFIKKQQEFQNLINYSTQNTLRLEKRIEFEKKRAEDSEENIAYLNKVINGNKTLIEASEQKFAEFREVNLQLDSLRGKLIEMEYLNNNNRTIPQKLISKFPSLFLLFKGKNNIKGALKNIQGYRAIKKNHLFDLSYYLKTYPDIMLSGNDPLLHYILSGYKEGRNPNPSFDGDYYLMKYKDVKNVNPLVHYALYGKKEGRNILKKEVKVSKNKDHDIIVDSGLFCLKWYINRYKLDPKEDPIIHYLKIGYKKSYNPSPTFKTELYQKNYPDVVREGINPLIHYIKYGIIESRAYPMFEDSLFQKYSIQQQKNIINAIYNEGIVSVIIPIYNAYSETKKCIASVFKHTNIPYQMILIDDCSTDERIGKLLDELEMAPNVVVLRNEVNQGFVKTVNRGLKYSEGDVVILNSDTTATSKWLQKLIVAGYSDDAVGTVTPFSDNSDIKLPEMEEEFGNLTIDETANLLEKVSIEGNIVAPTGNGFCLFIKRKTLDDVGLFDETFNQGYGEETDFTVRASQNNWKNVRNDSIFIHHERNASFSEDMTSNLKLQNKKILKSRYPNLTNEWGEFVSSKPIQDVILNIEHALNDYNPRKIYKKRVLYVSYTDQKGLPKINANFLEFQSKYDVIILTYDLVNKNLKLWKYKENQFFILNKIHPNQKWKLDEYRNFYFNLMLNLNIDVVVVLESDIIKSPVYKKQSSFINIASDLGLELIYIKITLTKKVKDIKYILEPSKTDDEVIDDEINKIDFSKKKMAIYTAITGNYDDLNIPDVVNPNFDYICFTDNANLRSDFWEIRLIGDLDLDNVRKARHFKILPHRYLADYDYSLWVDGAFKIVGDLDELVNKYAKHHQMLCFVHELRSSIYDEAQICIDLKKDSPDLINSQINKYLAEGYPREDRLIVSGILFRKHNDERIIKVMEDWYSEVMEFSRRDQLSFNYVAWKNDYKYDECEIFYWRNEYFTHKGTHNRKKLNVDHESIRNFDVSRIEIEKNKNLMLKFFENPTLELNHALWFVPFFDNFKQGEIYAIFELAQQFSIKEGTSNIFVLYGKPLKDLTDYEFELSKAFPKLNFELLNKNFISEEDLPYSDAAFCTLWNSAYSLVKYNNCKAKFYFNQDYEPLHYSAGPIYGLAEQSYRFGFIGITNSKGVADSHKKFNNKFVKYFTPSVDTEIFYPEDNRNRKKYRIVFYGRPNNLSNGFYLGIEALRKVKEHFKDNVEIFSVGSKFDVADYGLDGVLENLGLLPTIESVAELYRSCDLGLVFMFTPHPPYQPLEYMASGCATVTNINESNLWLLKDQENSVLTEPTVSCTADNIIKLLEDNVLREKIIMNGLKTVQLTDQDTELGSLVDFIKNPREIEY